MKRFYAALVLLVFVFAAHSVLAAPYAYITQPELGTLSVIDTVKHKKVTTINVGGAPYALTMSPDGRTAYVAHTTYPPMAGWISVIDVLTHSVIDTIPVGTEPEGAVVLPNGSKLYVTDCGSSPGITIIDTSSNSVVNTIPFGRCPWGIAAHPDGSKVYITDWTDNLVARIDTVSETVDMTMTVGSSPLGITIRPNSTEAYVTNTFGLSISVIDTSNTSVIDTIILPGPPDFVAFNTSGTRAYVTNQWGTADMWVIDTGSRAVVSTISLGTQSYGIDATPDGAYVYVAVCGWDEKRDKEINCGVRVIETATNTVKKKIKLPGGASSAGKFIGGPQYHMTVATSGSGKVISKKLPDIDCGGGGIKCEADFYVDRKVQLQAIADEGFVFIGWSGGACTKKSKNCTLVIKDDYSVTANFEPK
jgi:uncharacterized repeat protein (TIGR02543 family)